MDPIVENERCFGCGRPLCPEIFDVYWVVKTECLSGVGLHNLCPTCVHEARRGLYRSTVLAQQCYSTRDGSPITKA